MRALPGVALVTAGTSRGIVWRARVRANRGESEKSAVESLPVYIRPTVRDLAEGAFEVHRRNAPGAGFIGIRDGRAIDRGLRSGRAPARERGSGSGHRQAWVRCGRIRLRSGFGRDGLGLVGLVRHGVLDTAGAAGRFGLARKAEAGRSGGGLIGIVGRGVADGDLARGQRLEEAIQLVLIVGWRSACQVLQCAPA